VEIIYCSIILKINTIKVLFANVNYNNSNRERDKQILGIKWGTKIGHKIGHKNGAPKIGHKNLVINKISPILAPPFLKVEILSKKK
jgi:hypothetical protein